MENRKNKILLIVVILLGIFLKSNLLLAVPVSGGTTNSVSGGTPQTTKLQKLDNPIKADNVQTLLFTIVDLLIFLGTILAVLMFIYIGFKFVMARGKEGEITEAKEWFMWAAIGVAVLISSKVIVEVVKTTFINSGIVDEKLFTLPK